MGLLHNQVIPLGPLRAKPKLWGAEAQNTVGERVENLSLEMSGSEELST